MRIKLRQLKRKNGDIAFRLDTFLGYYVDENGKKKAKRIRETLPISIATAQAHQPRIRESILIQAEKIRNEKERELIETGLYPFFEKRKSHTNVLDFFESYIVKQPKTATSIALWRGVHKRLRTFCSADTQFKDINAAFCEQFLYSLQHPDEASQLKPLALNTVKNYYTRFIKVLREAKKARHLKKVPEVTFTLQNTSTNKVFLKENELHSLTKTFCANEDLKNAFLFAVETGLQFKELKDLKWKNINCTTSQWFLNLPNRTHQDPYCLPLNNSAKPFLGPPSPNPKLVFPRLKTKSENNIQLLKWAVRANIGKQLTFSISRNTFAYLNISHNSAIELVNKGLGHKNLRTTQNFISKLGINTTELSTTDSISKSPSSIHFVNETVKISPAIRVQLRNYSYVFTFNEKK